jgi:hypothetical protein
MSDSEKEALSDEEEEENVSSSDDSSEEEYISKDELINELETLIEIIKTKRVSRSFLQDIHDSIEEYITGDTKVLDPQIVNYIVQGWLVLNNMHRQTTLSENENLCPLCVNPNTNTNDTGLHYTLKNEVN